ncbi:hypothetical protein GN956_G6065 [Arapaima gigas]
MNTSRKGRSVLLSNPLPDPTGTIPHLPFTVLMRSPIRPIPSWNVSIGLPMSLRCWLRQCSTPPLEWSVAAAKTP